MSCTNRAVGISRINTPLEQLELPVGAPGTGEVRIRVAAAGVGMWDQYERRGVLGDLPLPRALGWEGSGVIEALGAGVDAFAVSDPVIAYVRLAGFYAEQVVVPAHAVARAPRNVSLADAAALPIAASTAWQALVERANVQSGQVVLITAGAGGTGTYAIELAKHLGARVVATAGPANQEFVRSLGADEVYNYADPAAIEAIRRAHPAGIDVLLDCVSAENWVRYADLVRSGGHAIGITPPLPAGPAGVERFELFSRGERATLDVIVELVERDVLHVHVGGRYPLAKAQQAQDQLAARHGRGRVLLIM
jgi:NADPH2:quinone reductase